MTIPAQQALSDLMALKSIIDTLLSAMYRELDLPHFADGVRELAPIWMKDTNSPIMMAAIADSSQHGDSPDLWRSTFGPVRIVENRAPWHFAYPLMGLSIDSRPVFEAQAFWYNTIRRAQEAGSYAVMGIALWQYMLWGGTINWIHLAQLLSGANYGN